MNNEIKEILDEMINLKDYKDYKIYGKRANEIGKLLSDYITNLQQELQEANDSITWWGNRFKAVERENERLKARLTDTEWQYDNIRIKVEKQYIEGITEELLEDIETCFFNGEEKPDIIPIDSLDICHIFGYIDYLKDYKSRCEKAYEDIKDIFKNEDWYKNYDYNDLANVLKNVSNILQNGSEDNEC